MLQFPEEIFKINEMGKFTSQILAITLKIMKNGTINPFFNSASDPEVWENSNGPFS